MCASTQNRLRILLTIECLNSSTRARKTMTTATEKKAKDFLLRRFRHQDYEFFDLGADDTGFDLWLRYQGRHWYKAEVKATNGRYQNQASIRANLVFNHRNQKEMFECGETVLVRVFLGQRPYKVIVVDCSVLSSGATVRQ